MLLHVHIPLLTIQQTFITLPKNRIIQSSGSKNKIEKKNVNWFRGEKKKLSLKFIILTLKNFKTFSGVYNSSMYLFDKKKQLDNCAVCMLSFAQ